MEFFYVRNSKYLLFMPKFTCTDTLKKRTQASTTITSIYFGSTFLDFPLSQGSLCIYSTPTAPWLLKHTFP